VRALYFGEKGRQLLGFHHAPVGKAQQTAVLCCHPAPQEYMRTYRAMRNMAESLSRSGLHVLRFDWSGTGDSAGDLRDTRLETWHQDLCIAAEELLDLSGAREIAIVGLRLGASVAARACSSAHPLVADPLVLWDPVIRGSHWLEATRKAHQRHLDEFRFDPPPDPGSLLGYPHSRALQADLTGLDLRTLGAPGRGRSVFLLPKASPEQLELAASWQAEVVHVPDAGDLDDPAIETAFLTGAFGRAVANALARGTS
jgi:hypothetical protein